MKDEKEIPIPEHMPLQAPPVDRTLMGSAAADDANGLQPCDNDHNFFVYGSC